MGNPVQMLTGPSTLQSSQGTSPGSLVMPAYNQMLSTAQNLSQNPNQSANYLNTPQQQGLGLLQQNANGGNPLVNAGNQQMLNTVNGNYLNPNSNPYLQDTINKALGSVRGSLGSTFSGNNFGSSAHEQLMNQQSTQAIAPFLMQNYQNERGLQANAIGQAPQYANYNANSLLNAGNAQQQIAAQQLGLLQGAVGTGLQGNTNTSGQQSNPMQGSALGSLLGSGLMAYALA